MDQTVAQALEEAGVDEFWAVVIENPDLDEPRGLAEVSVDAPEPYVDRRGLELVEDPDADRETGREFEVQAGEAVRQTITTNPNAAVAYYFAVLEQHDVDEDQVYASFTEELDVDMDAYEAWRDSLSRRDRRLRLLDQLESRIEHGAFNLQTYLDEGSFRETGLSDGQRRVAQKLLGTIETNPRRCYENAYEAVTTYDGGRDVRYVEGVALGEHPGRISSHAWVEIDGVVAEVTWPWHAPDPVEGVYFGVPVDEETLRERMAAREGTSNPLAIDDETYERMIDRGREELP